MIELSKIDKKKGLVLPKASTKLAEFFGLMAGDGFIGKYPSQYKSLLEISGDANLDKIYLETHVRPMIKGLFGMEPTFVKRKKQNTIYLRLCSKGLVNFLAERGFPVGYKNQIGVPGWILENDLFFEYFVKGIYDTDGSLALLNRRQKKFLFYPRVCLSSKSKPLIAMVNFFLIKKGLPTTSFFDSVRTDKRTGKASRMHGIHINGRKNLQKFMNTISFRNPRHLNKFEKYKKMGPPRFERGI